MGRAGSCRGRPIRAGTTTICTCSARSTAAISKWLRTVPFSAESPCYSGRRRGSHERQEVTDAVRATSMHMGRDRGGRGGLHGGYRRGGGRGGRGGRGGGGRAPAPGRRRP